MPRTAVTGARRLLGQRNFRWYFLARLISTAGSSLSGVAVTFAVLSVGTPGDLGLVMTVASTAMIVCVLAGGIVADRLPRRAVIQVTWTVSGLCQLAIAALLLTRTITVPAVALIAAVSSAASAFTMPAMQGLIPQVTERRNLQEADSLMALTRSTLALAGPVVGGLLIAGPGPACALVVDAVSFFVAVACYSQVRIPRGTVPASRLLDDLAHGWSQFAQRTWLWVVVLAFGLGNALFAGVFTVVGPVIATRTPAIGAHGWGLTLSAVAAGTILTTLLLLRLRLERPLFAGLIASASVAAPPLVLALAPNIPALMLSSALVGAGLQVFGTAWNVSLQEHVPEDALSRVVSYDMLGSMLLGPVGLAFYGWAADHVHLTPLLLGTSAALLVTQLAPLTVGSVRNLRRAEGGDSDPLPSEAS